MSSLTLYLAPLILCLTPTDPEAAPPPLTVGHRGLLLHAPENTMAGVRACLALRIGFEIDVRRAGDGTLVCLHDATVDRTTDGQGPIDQLSLEQIHALDAGSWFDPSFAGDRVPTLDDVLATLAEDRAADVLVAVDLKADDGRMASDVVGLARRLGVLDRLLFIGLTIGDPDLRRRLREADPSTQVARLAESPSQFEDALHDPDSDWVYVRAIPSGDDARRARAAGKRVFIAGPTVAGLEPDNWRAAASSGVDAVLTDHPLEFRAASRPSPR